MIKYLKSVGVLRVLVHSLLDRFTPNKMEKTAEILSMISCTGVVKDAQAKAYRCICGSKRFHEWNDYRV